MFQAREGFRAVLLGDGRLLVVGDDDCAPGGAVPGGETAEIYDPNTDIWTKAASLGEPRRGFAMDSTVDGGALVIGGMNVDMTPLSSTSIFDGSSGGWAPGPPLRVYDPSAPVGVWATPSVATADGQIYVASTLSRYPHATSVDVYARQADGWAGTHDTVIRGITIDQLIVLADGQIVGSGWGEERRAMVVTQRGAVDEWQPLPDPGVGFATHIVALPDGGFLAFGSIDGEPIWADMARVARYDPRAEQWISAAPLRVPRNRAQVTVLADGRVLVAGGEKGGVSRGKGEILTSTEIYDPVSDTWTLGPDLLAPRMGGQAVTLRDGSVLILGGIDLLYTGPGDVAPWCPEPPTTVERYVEADATG